ncbi:conserved Plasmodium protein, unknown function [Plasmodium relictum]|uniref:Ribosome maturation protein SBDS n=1 Tax=Plasmodium relictum TaxID=85471 RepID=A0A1J1HDM1_PLARL|nr:conserved Plasmodium protein, unknown function [Plasmodium relictum]CRH04028.1 conserved Plasmodium protein, unknown function [Plasmodium relictum]
MGALFQPINQVKFTNVAIVKYKHKGKKFEIACYKNKIIDWRDGVELNIDDVLQSHLIFTNISKGEIAKKSELNSCFNSDNNYEICKTILEKGTLQISNKERSILKEKVYKDMIEILHEMSVNPQTGYPLSTNMIESMVKNIGYSINIDDSAKKQALKVFDILSKEYDNVIQRAFMRIQIICHDFIKDDVIKFLNSHNVIIEEQKLTNTIKREDNIKNKCNQIYDYNNNIEKNKEQVDDEYGDDKEEYKRNINYLEQIKNVEENNKYENKKDINDSHQISMDKNNKDEYKNYTSSVIQNNCVNKNEENDLKKNNNFINDISKNDQNIYDKDTVDIYSIMENHISENKEYRYLSNKDEKESINFLDSKYLEEKNNIKNEICIETNEILMNESFNDDLKRKQKKKDKLEREKKGKNMETYKIVLLCYPYVYRYIDDFTKKHKKDCSSKILSNNVKIATMNQKKINSTENSVTKSIDIKDRIESKSNKNKKEKKKGKKKNNNNNDSEDEDEDEKKNKYKEKIFENNNDGNVENLSSENLRKSLNDQTNSLDVIMCTSCLTKIEKCNYKLHCRSDFHVYNVKRKYKKLPPITLEQYKEIDFDVSHFHVDM